MWHDILKVEKESKKRGKVNILGSNDSPHAIMRQWNVGDDEWKRRKIQAAELKKNFQEIHQITWIVLDMRKWVKCQFS
jgi:hypothetical protein